MITTLGHYSGIPKEAREGKVVLPCCTSVEVTVYKLATIDQM